MICPVFTDTVEDDHVVVDCISDDCQNCGDECLVNVESEWKDAAEEREESNHDDCSMSK